MCVSDGVPAQAIDHREGVACVGVDSDPPTLARQTPVHHFARIHRRFEKTAAMQGEADRSRTVVSRGGPLTVASAPDVGLCANQIGRFDGCPDLSKGGCRRHRDSIEKTRPWESRAGAVRDSTHLWGAFDDGFGGRRGSIDPRRIGFQATAGGQSRRGGNGHRQHRTEGNQRGPCNSLLFPQNQPPPWAYGVSCRAGAKGACAPALSGRVSPENVVPPLPLVFCERDSAYRSSERGQSSRFGGRGDGRQPAHHVHPMRSCCVQRSCLRGGPSTSSTGSGPPARTLALREKS